MKRSFLLMAHMIMVPLWTGTGHAASEPHTKNRLAIIGGGGAGLATAWLLENDYDVTLYEKQAYLGGHAETVQVTIPGEQGEPDATYGVEAGFQFFTEPTAPYFNRLLDILHVDIHKFQLSYTFANVGETGQADSVVLTPFHNKRINFGSFLPWQLPKLIQMQQLIEAGKSYVKTGNLTQTLEEVVEGIAVSRHFKDAIFYPIAAAGWGVTIEDIKKFSAYDVFKTVTQGMVVPMTAPTYESIKHGSAAYIAAEVEQLTQTTIKTSAAIKKISHEQGKYIIERESGESEEFDQLVITANSADTADLLKDITWTDNLRAILGQIEFYDTTIAIHGDVRLMPAKRSEWSWANVRYDGNRGSLTIYEDWRESPTPIFKSWIFPGEESMPEPLYAVRKYRHPYIGPKYFQVQHALDLLQGQHGLWFAGLYTFDVDSHESAIRSAMRIGEKLAPQADRLMRLKGEASL